MTPDDQNSAGPADSGSDKRFEALIERALRIDVPDSAARHAKRKLPRWPFIAVAASLLLAAGMLVNSLYDARYFGGDDLATDVIAHVLHLSLIHI